MLLVCYVIINVVVLVVRLPPHPSLFVVLSNLPVRSATLGGTPSPTAGACAIATSLHSFTASDLAQVDIHTWLELRSQLQKHHKARIEQYRFRRDPKAYLANLESRLL
ncbi:transposase [Nostoc sp. NIES-2111]|nr:transposase [Nostoc sp. NIES-2111]